MILVLSWISKEGYNQESYNILLPVYILLILFLFLKITELQFPLQKIKVKIKKMGFGGQFCRIFRIWLLFLFAFFLKKQGVFKQKVVNIKKSGKNWTTNNILHKKL